MSDMVAFVGGPLDGRTLRTPHAGRYLEGKWDGRYELAYAVALTDSGEVSVRQEYRFDSAWSRAKERERLLGQD